MSNTLAESIAKEAKMKASKIISKNERVQQEFDGVGKNVEQNDIEEGYTCEAENELCDENEQENEENREPLSADKIREKILRGAKPVMPMNDAELMKKLKQKYDEVSKL